MLPQGTLDTFVSSTRRPVSEAIFTSNEIHDRGSVFVANIYRAATPQDAKQRVEQMKRVVHSAKPATHEMSAWRCMTLKPGHSGLAGPEDFELQSGCKDDGERWAGGKILNVMETLGILDAVIIVSRWYGGEMLGPARFDHIAECATEVAKKFKAQEELLELRSLLESLDVLLFDLRKEYQQLSAEKVPPSDSTSSSTSAPAPKPTVTIKKPDYATLDVTKAKRLIRAREGSITSVKSLIAKLRASEDSEPALPPNHE
ncbi:ribosomal protein S5 domain 2-type protein [Ephemerocybe angulata]|uniref:Ribosomal protein S5 domain 2-type protein n=1 Tax=Ephemerocybe angulata TaxID=980116 RepID=A0A8H6I7A9_9AGAR|nr:ribosomal protein S5 domain 2-type protein [Tulosesus angulatus]